MTLSRECGCCDTRPLTRTKIESDSDRDIAMTFTCPSCGTRRTLSVRLDGYEVIIEWRSVV